jgi:peptide/nickel transport system substrate-binding protein
MKLSYPYLGTLLVLAHNTYFYVLPREADGGFDPRSEARGTGPFRLEEWVPSLHYSFKKNSDWIEKNKGRPFLDGFKRTLVPEYAAGLAQFEAGHLWDFNVRSADVLRTKKTHPEMVLRQSWALGAAGFGHTIRLSQQADSVMRDERVRQAASMLIDRETWIRAMHGTDEYEAEGLPGKVMWNSHLPAYLSEWLDPQGKDLGEGAKYFQFNVAEAKKLLAAAGYDRNKTVSFFHSRQQDAAFNSTLQAMMSEGFGTDFQILEHNPQWVQTCQTSFGQGYNGFCYYPVAGFSAENYLQTKYTPEGKTAITDKPIPGLTDLVNKIKTEIDAEKQKQLIKEAQKEAAKLMPDILLPGFSYGFQLNQPWLENYGVYSANWISARLYLDYWYNATKKTS